MTDEDVWFAPKRFGYGSGMPVRWQGWALVATSLCAMLLLTAALAERQRVLPVALLVLASVPMLVMSARHTRGGWRWRWGGRR